MERDEVWWIMYFPQLKIQEQFRLLWVYFGLEKLAPLSFNVAKDGQTPPHAVLMTSLKSQSRFSLGSAGRVAIEGRVYLPQASPDRARVEASLFRVSDEWRNVVDQELVRELLVVDQKIQQGTDRFAGGNEEIIPVAWEMWFEVRHVRGHN